MEPETKEFLTLFAIMAVLDYMWLGVVRKSYIRKKIMAINGGAIEHPWMSFVIAYFLMATGLYHFVMKRRRLKTKNELVLDAAFFGLVVYGVFDMSMMNLVGEWNAIDAMQDMAWGAFMFALTVAVTVSITG